MVYIWTISNCYVGLRIRLIALILSFIHPFFCLFKVNLCHSFLRYVHAGTSNIVYIWRMSDCIVRLRLILLNLVLLFFYPFFLSFPILYVNFANFCHGFLKN